MRLASSFFPHYLPAYQSEAIKVAAGIGFWLSDWDDFHSSKLAMATAYFGAKKKENQPH